MPCAFEPRKQDLVCCSNFDNILAYWKYALNVTFWRHSAVRKMVDRVYKEELPALRKTLERLREDFSLLDSETDWTKLRIEPLQKHLESLEQLLGSREFSQEFSRLRKGVVLFHSDLVYFRTNIKGLKKLLLSEKKSRAKN